MKIINTIYLLGFVLSLFVFTACDDLLDVENVNKTSPNGFIKDSKSKENAIASAYILANRALTENGAWAYYSDVRAGLVKPSNNLKSIFLNQDLSAINASMEFYRDWNRYYEAIAQCNYIINEMNNVNTTYISGEEQERAIGEALFLRAYLYFQMTKIWGDVPLVLTHGSTSAVTKSDKSEVRQQVIVDLEKVEKLLPDYFQDEYNQVSLYWSRRRATRPATLALIANVSLEMGDYEKGIAAFEAFQAIEASTFNLERINTISNVFGGSSRENIFGFETPDDLYADIRNPYRKDVVYLGREVKELLPDTNALKVIYAADDARLSSNFDTDNNGVVSVVKFNKDYQVVSRYGDLLLTASELYYNNKEFGKSTDLLNQVRSRAKLPELDSPASDVLFAAIKDERGRELYAEGHSFFDYMRWGESALRVQGITEEQVSLGIELWPLSSESLGSFFNVTQNNYWK